MDLKTLKFKIFHGASARRLLLRAFALAIALSIVPLLQNLSANDFGDLGFLNSDSPNICACSSSNDTNPFMFPGANLFSCIWGGSVQCNENVNLTVSVVRELMSLKMLNYDAKALCVGQGSAFAVRALRVLGFSNAVRVYELPFFTSLRQKKFEYELRYDDNAVDFVLSRDLDKLSGAVPAAVLVLEIERVLKPGGIGAMLVGRISGSEPNSLIRSATPISSLLKSSSVVHVGHVNDYALVVFKKKLENDNVALLEQYRDRLPADCPSIRNNKAFMDQIEPLMLEKPIDFENKIVYLPKFIDVQLKKRLVYIDIGAGDHLNSNVSSWFMPSYPVDSKAFDIYFVDHNTSVILSYVKKPGVTFVYHPGLAVNRTPVDPDVADDWDPSEEEEEFDFLLWFKETVQDADFVVLKMNTGAVELQFLSDLFESGAICFVDELFLHCPDGGDCTGLFKALRSSGVFVHQWWGY